MTFARLLLAAAIAFAPALAQHQDHAAQPAAPAAAPAGEHAQPAPGAQPAGEHAQPAAAGAEHAPNAEHAKSEAHGSGSHGGGEGHGNSHAGLEIWKWANFLLLAGGLGYLIGKNAGPFFASRSEQIAKDITEADRLRRDAEARAADVERRLAALQAEIDALRTESLTQQAAEAERLRQHTASEILKIQQQAETEIASAGKAARTELKQYSAGLALELAENKIRAAITPEAQDALVKGFVQDLGRAS